MPSAQSFATIRLHKLLSDRWLCFGSLPFVCTGSVHFGSSNKKVMTIFIGYYRFMMIIISVCIYIYNDIHIYIYIHIYIQGLKPDL